MPSIQTPKNSNNGSQTARTESKTSLHHDFFQSAKNDGFIPFQLGREMPRPKTAGNNVFSQSFFNHLPNPLINYGVRGIPGYMGQRKGIGPDNVLGGGWTEMATLGLARRRPQTTGRLRDASERHRKGRVPMAGASMPGYTGFIPGKEADCEMNGQTFAQMNKTSLEKVKPSTAPAPPGYKDLMVQNDMWITTKNMDLSLRPRIKSLPKFPKHKAQNQTFAKAVAVSQKYGTNPSYQPPVTPSRGRRVDPWEKGFSHGQAGSRYWSRALDRYRPNEHKLMVQRDRLYGTNTKYRESRQNRKAYSGK